MNSIKISAVLLTLFLAVGCASDFKEVPSPTGSSIAQIASTNDDFNILTALVTKTGLVASLANNNSGAFTVFAPTDAAFVSYFNSLTDLQLPPGAAAAGTFNESSVLAAVNLIAPSYTPAKASAITTASVTNILLYHMISSEIKSSAFTGAQGFTTFGGTARLSISKSGNGIILNANRAGQNVAGNGGQSVSLDIDASNGVIHSIDKVLIPVALANIWIGTSPASGAVVDLPGFNVDYTTLTGGKPTVTVFTVAMPRKTDGTLNVATAAVGTLNNYNLLSAAIARAELAPVIRPIATPFPDFTVFAPTDAVFQAFLATLPNTGTPVTSEATARDFINTLSPTVLADILKYHVVPGRILSTDLSNGQVVTTALAGGTFTVDIAGSVITLKDNNTGVADPTVTSANILTNAGVLHQINGVLRSN
ncbi:MAG: fasciclin domain-containing protein [Bacteroidetes bacterium]|nr:fasciclin domain-containing protein [Bacteroidota bacterium]